MQANKVEWLSTTLVWLGGINSSIAADVAAMYPKDNTRQHDGQQQKRYISANFEIDARLHFPCTQPMHAVVAMSLYVVMCLYARRLQSNLFGGWQCPFYCLPHARRVQSKEICVLANGIGLRGVGEYIKIRFKTTFERVALRQMNTLYVLLPRHMVACEV